MTRFVTLVIVAAAAAVVGCAGEPSSQELVEEHPNLGVARSDLQRDPGPSICLGSCPHSPDFEPLGQICWLDRQACLNGILTCYYHCEPIEDALSEPPGPGRRAFGLANAAESRLVADEHSRDGGVITIGPP